MNAIAKFNEKLSILNEEFVRFLTVSIKKTPHADLTPTINDYSKYLAELDDMYAEKKLDDISAEKKSDDKYVEKKLDDMCAENKGRTSAIQPFNIITNMPSSEKNDDNDEEEEEPPKPEEVDQKEKDAIFSCKCAMYIFQDKKYEKRGVGFLSVKILNEKKQFLIREATTLGRLVVNTFINDSLKWKKIDPKKIRISYPKIVTNKDPTTDTTEEKSVVEIFMLRFGAETEVNGLIEHLESDSK